jgi:hypothetical protein
MTIASVPDARGGERTAYAFVPFTTCSIKFKVSSFSMEGHRTTHPRRGHKGVLLGGRGYPQFPKLVGEKRGSPNFGVK